MSLNEAIQNLSSYSLYIVLYFAFCILTTLLLNLFYKKERRSKTIELFYSAMIYATAIPGIFSISLLFYTLLFLKGNILQLDIFSCYLPIISMLAVFVIISRKTDFARLPGFDKLSGLMMILAVIYFVLFFLDRLRFHIMFFGSFEHLLLLGAGLFVLLKIGIRKLKKKKL